MSAQTLRDNAARFCKDNLLLDVIEVKERNDVEPNVVETRVAEQDSIEKMLMEMKAMKEKTLKIRNH